MNDSLPDDSTPQWQRGGWLLVDRLTGRISAVNLPEFDVVYSAATWYRDYVAYAESPMTATNDSQSLPNSIVKSLY